MLAHDFSVLRPYGGGNIKKTTARLGIERSPLHEEIKKYATERRGGGQFLDASVTGMGRW